MGIYHKSLSVIVLLVLGAFSFYLYKNVLVIPAQFPVGKIFVINEGESLKRISYRLQESGYITSPVLFRAGISFLDKDRTIQLGVYEFTTPMSLLGIVHTFVKGHPDAPLISATIPEGSTTFEIASIIMKVLPTLSFDIFNESVAKYKAQGKLFPSTYFLLPSYSEEDIVKLMLATFTKKVGNTIISPARIVLPLTNENDVLTLASIIEGEAKYEEDMKVIAGILLTRLSIGMPLQVDVALETYKKKGLPKSPINNPGIVAINAVLYPTTTSYLYYITGNDAKMYYAKTFEEHKNNIRKYLK